MMNGLEVPFTFISRAATVPTAAQNGGRRGSVRRGAGRPGPAVPGETAAPPGRRSAVVGCVDAVLIG